MTSPMSVAVVWSGDPTDPRSAEENPRAQGVLAALVAAGLSARLVVYDDTAAEAVRRDLLTVDGALVWVDPLEGGRDRSVLDQVLRDVSAQGVFVSTHPDVILKLGTKEVLYQTQHMAWGSDTRLHRTLDELRRELLPALRSSGPRVLKQHRGNGGIGVWKVTLVKDAESPDDIAVRLQEATRNAFAAEMSFAALVSNFEPYFRGPGRIIDQAYQERLPEGMVRCYMVQDRVAGFGHQMVTALIEPPPGQPVPLPADRVYYGPSKPEFQRLKTLLERGWLAEMQSILEIEREDLPVLWDADFLLGPKDANREDTYVLCEVNVSCVSPMPVEALAPLAQATRERLEARR